MGRLFRVKSSQELFLDEALGTTVHTNEVNTRLKVAHIELGVAVHILGNHHLAKSVINLGKTFAFHIENAGGRVRIDGELRSLNILDANTRNGAGAVEVERLLEVWQS